jgi:hypothetical protein
MASGRNRLTFDEVLERIFESSDDDSNDENDYISDEDIIEEVIAQAVVVNEQSIVQSALNRQVPTDTEFGWSQSDSDCYIMPFSEENGLTCDLPENACVPDFFNILFDADMWETLTEQTNLYTAQILQKGELKPNSRMQKWTPVSVDEMKVFLV